MAQQPRFTPLTAPQINLNGDTAEQLLTEIMEMRSATFSLMKLMRGTAIAHPRNFQTMRHAREISSKAQAAWDQRVQFLLNLYAEMHDLAENILDQKKDQPHRTIQ